MIQLLQFVCFFFILQMPLLEADIQKEGVQIQSSLIDISKVPHAVDTITNWQIYLNDKALVAYNIFTPPTTDDVAIQAVKLSFSDQLIVWYNTFTVYYKTRKLILKDEEGNALLLLEEQVPLGFSTFKIDGSTLKQMKGKGILSVCYNEYADSEAWAARTNTKLDYTSDDSVLGFIKVE